MEVRRGINNLVKAIEAGVFSEATKARLDELEAEQNSLQGMIAFEQSKVTTVTRAQILEYLEGFRNGNIDDPAFQKLLFTNFLIKVFLDDDKYRVVFNYTDGQDTMEFPLTPDSIENAESAVECSYKASSGPPRFVWKL